MLGFCRAGVSSKRTFGRSLRRDAEANATGGPSRGEAAARRTACEFPLQPAAERRGLANEASSPPPGGSCGPPHYVRCLFGQQPAEAVSSETRVAVFLPRMAATRRTACVVCSDSSLRRRYRVKRALRSFSRERLRAAAQRAPFVRPANNYATEPNSPACSQADPSLINIGIHRSSEKTSKKMQKISSMFCIV